MPDRIKFACDYSNSLFIAERVLKAPFREHTHDYTELTIVFRGFAVHVLDGHEMPARAGDVFILRPELKHSFPVVADFAHYVFSYKQEMLDMVGSDIKSTQAYQALFALGCSAAGKGALLRLSLEAMAKVEALVNSMLSELKAKGLGFDSLVKARFIELLTLLCREYEARSSAPGTPLDVERAAKLASLLESNLKLQPPVSRAAKSLGVSERQLRRVFKKHYGQSPIEYLMKIRLKRAAKMIASTHLTLSEIAFECGFSDANYLSHQFKKSTGLSPRQWKSGGRSIGLNIVELKQ